MGYWRKKPIIVEAVLITDGGDLHYYPIWVTEAALKGTLTSKNRKLFVRTMKGTMEGHPGSFLIRGVKGELYICEEQVFYESYEAVETPAKG